MDWAQIRWANSLWASADLINFSSCLNEYLFFPGLWLVEQFQCICRQTDDWIGLKFGGLTHHGLPHAQLTCHHTPLNFFRFLASASLSHSTRSVSFLPLVYITNACKSILCNLIWQITHNNNRLDSGHCDGTGHRKMAMLSMASGHGDNPWKFHNYVIV